MLTILVKVTSTRIKDYSCRSCYTENEIVKISFCQYDGLAHIRLQYSIMAFPRDGISSQLRSAAQLSS